MTRAEILRVYLARGWRPIPLHHVRPDGRACSCPAGEDCSSPGKHPVATGWQRPVLVPSIWWAAHPRANVGLATGRSQVGGSGFWVLDVDPRHGGVDRLNELIDQHDGAWPATHRVDTPSGGMHFYWALPAGAPLNNSRGALPHGLDVRADGGQVAAPDSVGLVDLAHPERGLAPYTATNQLDVAEPPAWLVALVRGEREIATPAAGPSVPAGGSASVATGGGGGQPLAQESKARTSPLDAFLTRVVEGEAAKVADAVEGERNHVLNNAAFAIGTILAHEGHETHPVPDWFRELAQDTLLDVAMGIGLPRAEARATIASGFRGGARKPREWPPPELDTSSIDDLALTELGIELPPGADRAIAGDPFSDANMATVLSRNALAGNYCWVNQLSWFAWDGRRWAPCDDTVVMEVARNWALDQFERVERKHNAKLAELEKLRTPFAELDEEARAVAELDLEKRKLKLIKEFERLRKGWASMQARSKRNAVISDCKGVVGLNAEQLDVDLHLLNTPNGVVDLRTGQLLPHDPARYMTRITSAEYHPGAESPVWKQALEALPHDVREWYQVVAGQAATGYTMTEDRLLIAHGGGENGKGVINNEGIAAALGSYAGILSDKVLLANPGDHPVELMQLQGIRLALLDETPETRHLDTQRLKRVLGQPTITARNLNKSHITFRCTHTLIINTNHLPRVLETDHGTWRRLQALTFPFTFVSGEEPMRESEREGDLKIKDKLATPEAQQAVLAWIVAGAVAWFANDKVMLPTPARVAADTTAWRRSMDVLMGFMTDRMVAEGTANVAVNELLAELNSWLDERGQQAWSAQLLLARLSTHDLARRWGVGKETISVRRASVAGAATSRRPVADGMVLMSLPSRYAAVTGLRFMGGGELDDLEDLADQLATPVPEQRGGELDDAEPFD